MARRRKREVYPGEGTQKTCPICGAEYRLIPDEKGLWRKVNGTVSRLPNDWTAAAEMDHKLTHVHVRSRRILGKLVGETADVKKEIREFLETELQ